MGTLQPYKNDLYMFVLILIFAGVLINIQIDLEDAQEKIKVLETNNGM